MRRLLLLLALLPASASAQSVEADVTAALEAVIARGLSAGAEGLASHLACYSGVGEAAAIRPCFSPVDSARVEAVAGHVRETYAGDPVWVLDWLRTVEDDDVPQVQVQIKVRSADPSVPVAYRFVLRGDGLLLADAGPVRLTRPERPPPATDEEAVQRTMERLFRLTGPDDGPDAAPFFACPDPGEESIHRCDYTVPAERARVEGLRARIGALLERVGPTGWGFTGYRTKTEREGTWHLLLIGYRDGDAAETAYAAFIEAGDGLALGDLAEWPD